MYKKIIYLTSIILATSCSTNSDTQEQTVKTPDYTEIEKKAVGFYNWYAKVTKDQVHKEYQADFVEGDSGMATLNYSKEIENYKTLYLTEDLINKVVESYQPCIKELNKIKYSRIDSMDLDQFESIGCNFFNFYDWTETMEQLEGADLDKIVFDGNESATAFVKLFDYQDSKKTYWTAHSEMKFKKNKKQWYIDKVEIVPNN